MMLLKTWKEIKPYNEKAVAELLDEFQLELGKADAYESNSYHQECALYSLLRQYQLELPVLDYYFHKGFRQTDVTDSGYTDSAIWHLLQGATVFWKLFDKYEFQRDEKFNVIVEEKKE